MARSAFLATLTSFKEYKNLSNSPVYQL